MTIIDVDSILSEFGGDQERATYRVTEIRKSESAFIFFSQLVNDPKQKVVLKILREYADTRYQLTNVEERLKCQREALRNNREVNPDVYKGLAPILSPNLAYIEELVQRDKADQLEVRIGSTYEDIDNSEAWIEPNRDYALVMMPLAERWRLDNLLRQMETRTIKEFLKLLVERIFHLHQKALCLPCNFHYEDNQVVWGSYDQIQKKLLHNIELFNNLAQLDNPLIYRNYSWLKKELYNIIADQRWESYFARRIEMHCIKQCHGDLKVRNIWIETKELGSNFESCIRILDAIDFNPAYYNIDVLSDIAMLATDVQAVKMQLHEYDDDMIRSGHELADFIINTYLNYAGQDNDEIAKTVLAYYMLEKAIVRASVSLFYDIDESPRLGMYFLKIASQRMKILKDLLLASDKATTTP